MFCFTFPLFLAFCGHEFMTMLALLRYEIGWNNVLYILPEKGCPRPCEPPHRDEGRPNQSVRHITL